VSWAGSQLPGADRRALHWDRILLRWHIDWPLLLGIGVLAGLGLTVLYSASGQDIDVIVRQLLRLAMGGAIMLGISQVTPQHMKRWAPALYSAGMLLLVAVLIAGEIGKGAQRWLDLGIVRFQPSEIMKVAVPLMVAGYLSDRHLPIRGRDLLLTGLLILLPTALIAKQPDLGTSLLVASAGVFVLFLAGLSWKLIAGLTVALAGMAPAFWYLMHDYQRTRVLIFLNPEMDPLGAGYHIIQSKIAIGSGGFYGKGWLNGTQSHLDFIPEPFTDFIFAVFGEEFGLLGGLALLAIYVALLFRGMYIATQAQDSFSRLLAGSLTLTLLVYVFVNIGMVTGLLPVVGLPLPLVSYGGTSMVTLFAGFGMLMSIHTHRKLLSP
jgi:rod shape determining protein RodA